MREASLIKAIELIIEALNNSDIPIDDKTELMININEFLKNYKENIDEKISNSSRGFGFNRNNKYR